MENDKQNDGNAESGAPSSGNPSFFSELKRRKVFRVAGTYAVVAWLIIQVASATFSDFGIPAWAFRFVVLMVLLGFPIAIILAWAFQLTDEGVRKTSAARKSDSGEDKSGLDRKRNWYAIGLAAALPTLIFGTFSIIFYLGQGPSEKTEVSISNERPYVIGTVAVLPFTIISDDARLKITADGLQEEMLTALSEMDPLNVVSRTSTLQYHEKRASIPEIGEALGSDYIVEASIQGVGENLRVTLQLIEARTDNHVWADSFDRNPDDSEDFLQFQKELSFELAIRVYDALEDRYPPSSAAEIIREEKLNQLHVQLDREYEAFWKNFMGADWKDQYFSIVGLIDEILKIDPNNKMAYDRLSGISYASTDVGINLRFDPEWRKEFYLILMRAFSVYPNGFDVNKHLGVYYYHYENRPGLALPYSRKAVDLEKETRGVVDVYTYWILLQSLYATGLNSAALDIVKEATREGYAYFSGGNIWIWTQAYFVSGLYEEALKFVDEQTEDLKNDDSFDPVFKEGLMAGYKFVSISIIAAWTADRKRLYELRTDFEAEHEIPDYFAARMAYFDGDYEKALDHLSRIQADVGTFSISALDLAEFRGWLYLKSGNTALAKSYFRGFLNELEDSPKAAWMQQFEPDQYAAKMSFAHACLDNDEEAERWAKVALEEADPTRNYEDYFHTLSNLSISYTMLGNYKKACELIDQTFSSPTWIKLGHILISPELEDLHGSPEFKALAYKYAHTLKDPAILEEFFGPEL